MDRDKNPCNNIIEVQRMCEKYKMLVHEIVTLNTEAEQLADNEHYQESIEKYTMIIKLLQLAIELSDDISICTINNEDDIMNRLFCKKMDMQCINFKGKIIRVKKIIKELELMQKRSLGYTNEIDDENFDKRMNTRQNTFENMHTDFTQNFENGASEDMQMMNTLINEIPNENDVLRNALNEMKKRYSLLLKHCKNLHKECQNVCKNNDTTRNSKVNVNVKLSTTTEDEKKKKPKKNNKNEKKFEMNNNNKMGDLLNDEDLNEIDALFGL